MARVEIVPPVAGFWNTDNACQVLYLSVFLVSITAAFFLYMWPCTRHVVKYIHPCDEDEQDQDSEQGSWLQSIVAQCWHRVMCPVRWLRDACANPAHVREAVRSSRARPGAYDDDDYDEVVRELRHRRSRSASATGSREEGLRHRVPEANPSPEGPRVPRTSLFSQYSFT